MNSYCIHGGPFVGDPLNIAGVNFTRSTELSAYLVCQLGRLPTSSFGVPPYCSGFQSADSWWLSEMGVGGGQ